MIDLDDGYGCQSLAGVILNDSISTLLLYSSQDGDFSEQRFRDIVNAGLANNIGNILNRTLALLSMYCEGKVPDLEYAPPSEQDKAIRYTRLSQNTFLP